MAEDAASSLRRRRWRALGAGTAVATLAVWAMVIAIVTVPDESSDAGALSLLTLLLAVFLVPVAFYVVARIAGRERPHRVAARAWGIAFVAIPVTFVAGDPVTGLVAGLGFGGAHSLPQGEHHTRASRWSATGLAVVYAWVLLRLVLALALLVVPLLPLGAVGLADAWQERRAARRMGDSGRR